MTPEEIAAVIQVALSDLESDEVSGSERRTRIEFARLLYERMNRTQQSAIFEQELVKLKEWLDTHDLKNR